MGTTQTWNSEVMPVPVSIHNKLWETYERSIADLNGRRIFIIEKHKKTLLLLSLLLKFYYFKES
jgi:hypothetical protein